jgi:hypothetical protein
VEHNGVPFHAGMQEKRDLRFRGAAESALVSTMNYRLLHALLVPVFSVAFLVSGCKREQRADLAPEVDRLTAELDATKKKLAATELDLAAKGTAPSVPAVAEPGKIQPVEKDKGIAKKDEEIAKLQAEITSLRKSDGVVFAEIRAVQAEGMISTALGRYQQFVLDFPTSPLVPNAKLAIAELAASVTRRADETDPGHREREVKKRFTDGVVTLEEVAPVLKKKSAADVVKYLGPPSKTLRNGTELGYADKGINSGNGERGMLIIRFEEGLVAGVRVDYGGREVKP